MTEPKLLIAHIGHTCKHHEHVTWWKPDSIGYTICIDKAGRYTQAEAWDICRHGSCIAIHAQEVEPLARSTPYYRKSDGALGKLYDGDKHRPVPNSRDCWNALMRLQAFRLYVTQKPTPIGAKARAIYIDTILA